MRSSKHQIKSIVVVGMWFTTTLSLFLCILRLEIAIVSNFVWFAEAEEKWRSGQTEGNRRITATARTAQGYDCRQSSKSRQNIVLIKYLFK